MLRVEMLSSGDEVLHGHILDSNAAWLGRWLFEHGAPLCGRATVGDEIAALCAAIAGAARRADVLIVNGGLGPTRDDLSTQAAAQVLGVALEENDAWMARMQVWFAQRGRSMPPATVSRPGCRSGPRCWITRSAPPAALPLRCMIVLFSLHPECPASLC